MKKKLLIKINDILVDVSKNYDKAVKKSIEFFVGTMVDMEEISSFRKKKCASNNFECINLFLNQKGMYLRESALLKKFKEYFIGREFEGFISDCTHLEDLRVLEKLSKKYDVILVALMSDIEAEFLVSKFELKNYPIIVAESLHEAFLKVSGNRVFLGSSVFDLEAATRNDVEFIGYKMEKGSYNSVEKMEELI